MADKPKEAYRIIVSGTVQGIGFRPFVYRLARELGLNGFVRNTLQGVEIVVEGNVTPTYFIKALKCRAPVNARIDRIEIIPEEAQHYTDFLIHTTADGKATVFTPPDLYACGECLKELFSPSDRRYCYPFINCTGCGPRYTIIETLPYDREKTTMRAFKMCPQCEKEYHDPLHRRFHAEPNACPVCGPKVFLVEDGRKSEGGIERAIERIKEGKIVALKGLGGFHLLCDAQNIDAVKKMRALKGRERKPFALMAHNLGIVKEIASVSDEEEYHLNSGARPIVLLKKKGEIEGIAPGLDTYGIMLPYTPLHALFLEEVPLVVATSANLRGSPILKDESEGVDELSDCIVTHDREITVRCDDSVLKAVEGVPVFFRRARGFVPEPIALHCETGLSLLAFGGELKNTVSVLKENYILTSQYLGDMKDLRNKRYLDEVVGHFRSLYDLDPDMVCCDLHPDFTTTRTAEAWGRPVLKVQHHVAHIYAVLAEHCIKPDEPFLGIAFDGAGYGEDGCLWGGEFFVGGKNKIERFLHMRYVPQQGGDLAVREPWRMALGYLMDSCPETGFGKILEIEDKKKAEAAASALRKGINSPLTSSMGRFFDAVSAIAGVAPLTIDYEAEAAAGLETIALEDIQEYYPFRIGGREIDARETLRSIIEEKEPPSVISGKFHNTVTRIIEEVSELCMERHDIKRVILSGGVFLNSLLLKKAVRALREKGVEVYFPQKFSPGDEAISLGQIYYAVCTI